MLRQAFHRHEAAPDHDAGELGFAAPKHLLANAGVNAIGANEDVPLDAFTVCQKN